MEKRKPSRSEQASGKDLNFEVRFIDSKGRLTLEAKKIEIGNSGLTFELHNEKRDTLVMNYLPEGNPEWFNADEETLTKYSEVFGASFFEFLTWLFSDKYRMERFRYLSGSTNPGMLTIMKNIFNQESEVCETIKKVDGVHSHDYHFRIDLNKVWTGPEIVDRLMSARSAIRNRGY